MKKILFLFLAAVTFSCSSGEVKYACPMKCEEGKVYEKKGVCPICEMDLEEIEVNSKK